MAMLNTALQIIPESHRKPLFEEYNSIITNYMEQRWSPSELSGGRFCEIVYSVLFGMGNTYSAKPFKPKNIVDDCKNLENNTKLPRSFRILILRMLPALYDVRNNRGVGHVGSEVNANHMDATLVLSMVNWIMAELVRELHSVSIDEAQNLVDKIAEKRIPLVWKDENIKRILNKKILTKDQILIFLEVSPEDLSMDQLLIWTEYKRKDDFKKILKKLHSDRFIEWNIGADKIKLLPPGSKHIQDIINKYKIV